MAIGKNVRNHTSIGVAESCSSSFGIWVNAVSLLAIRRRRENFGADELIAASGRLVGDVLDVAPFALQAVEDRVGSGSGCHGQPSSKTRTVTRALKCPGSSAYASDASTM
jgi:hypothetical protein